MTMNLGWLLFGLAGAVVGALIGKLNRCATGACPLTANWRRGALYGAALGLLFYLATNGVNGTYPKEKNVRQITAAEFNTEVAQAGKPVVVDFFATWCGPCRLLAPRLDKLAGEFAGRIKFVSVDVDQAPALAQKFDVEEIPRLIFFGPDGKVVDSSVGVLSEDMLRAKLQALADAGKPTGPQKPLPEK